MSLIPVKNCLSHVCCGSEPNYPRLLHVYLDRESQHRLMSCMRMKTCMKMVAVWGYASGPGWCVSCQIEHTRTHLGDCTYTVFGPREIDQSSQSTSQRSIQSNTDCCMNLTELSFSWADVKAHSRYGIRHPTTLYISRVFLLLSSICILSLFTRFSPSIFQHRLLQVYLCRRHVTNLIHGDCCRGWCLVHISRVFLLLSSL
jgi:hypothetical protein